MKKDTKNILLVFIISILIACFATMTLFAGNTRINASASITENQIQESSNTVKKNSENMISETREEYKDLIEYSYSAEIESEMEKTGMTVGESLVDQLCYYQQLVSSVTDEQEITKINTLIRGTKEILDMYQSVASESEVSIDTPQQELRASAIDVPTYASTYALAATAVPAAIAWFNASNYLLSAELLTHAWIENFFPGDYSPVNGNRVVGSLATYDFINSNLIEDQINYNISAPDPLNTTTCYEEDLGFALHSVNICRSNVESKEIQITDIYDFTVYESYNSVLAALISVFALAQSYGIIGDYNVIINVDVSDPLYLNLNSTSNGVHSISVYNLSNKAIEVAYNTKMCLPDHAKLFLEISDIDFISIPANGYVTVNISENLLASYITFCYIKDGYKIITYADELYLDRNILNVTFETRKTVANDIAIVTKVGSKWLINITNTYSSSMKVDYNTKMCNENDAKSWTNLKDIDSFNLSSDNSKFVYISENGFATHIAARFISNTYEYYIYANNLSINGTMTIGRRTEYVYNYLQITNQGKTNGKWNIKIMNPLTKGITVYYNSKMCNFNDAKNWTGLNDIKSVYIPAKGSCVVPISEYWFATSIAISYIYNNYRLISFADNLSTKGTMNVYNNKI